MPEGPPQAVLLFAPIATRFGFRTTTESRRIFTGF